jgi:CRISPR/Cas system-associated protein Cas7 (RAMP superfamily)
MKQQQSLTGSEKASNLATLSSQERLNLRETMRQTEAMEWIRRFKKKALEEGGGEAQYWWQQTLADIAKKRGQLAADDLRQRMNRIKNENSRKS